MYSRAREPYLHGDVAALKYGWSPLLGCGEPEGQGRGRGKEERAVAHEEGNEEDGEDEEGKGRPTSTPLLRMEAAHWTSCSGQPAGAAAMYESRAPLSPSPFLRLFSCH